MVCNDSPCPALFVHFQYALDFTKAVSRMDMQPYPSDVPYYEIFGRRPLSAIHDFNTGEVAVWHGLVVNAVGWFVKGSWLYPRPGTSLKRYYEIVRIIEFNLILNLMFFG